MFSVIDVLYLIFAFFSIYFTFLFLLIFFEKKEEMEGYRTTKKFPFVSFIVAAHNEERIIKKMLENLKKVDYPNYEIIVVNDGSTDRTSEIAKKCKVKVIDKKKTGKADSLNSGLKYARGEIVACVDADSFPKKDCLKKTVGFFEDPKIGAVTVTALVKNPKSFLEKMQELEYAMIAWNRKLLDFIDSVYVTPGTLSLYRKNLLIKLGGFDRKNLTEDIEMTWRIRRAGYEAKMVLSTETYTIVPKDLKKWFRQRVRWTIGGFQTLFKYKDTFFKRIYGSLGLFICPFFMLGFILSLLALAIYSYVYFDWIIKNIIFFYKSYSVGASMPTIELIFLPNIFTIMGLTIFFLSIFYVYICLRSLKLKIMGFKNFFNLLCYLVFYLSVFPFIILISLVKILRQKYEW
ncbi:MAG: glycosyltransferase [Candidatus Aenigmatarchaeota archaeon]